jgi:hypothetical protein
VIRPADPRRRGRLVAASVLAALVCPAFLVPTATATDLPTPTGTPTDTPAGTPTATPTDTPTGTPTATPDAAPEEPEPEIPADPLQVVIDRLNPSVVPQRGTLVVTGWVRNLSEEPWSELTVYALTSREPLTTSADLTAAVASDPRTEVGERIVEPSVYVRVPDLEPGESTRFRLEVPRDLLGVSGAPGVYWFGVHVLGTSPAGRLDGADGRARTFLPLVPGAAARTELALGVQFRNHVVRAPDGSLEFLPGWQDTLGGGRLARLLRFSTSAGDVPLTWVVDPAVVDAAVSVAQGNPPLGLEEPPSPADLLPGDGGGDDSDGGDGGGDGGGGNGGGEEPEQLGAEEAAARGWVRLFALSARQSPVLALPYGDLDVPAAARHRSADLLTTALDQSGLQLAELDVAASPVLLPADGRLSPEALTATDATVPVVLPESALTGDALVGSEDNPQLRARPDAGRVLLAPTAESLLGPTPGRTRSALAVRQRLLADLAVHALSPERDVPLVRFLPPGWDPGPRWRRAEFFAGLDVPWLDTTPVSEVLAAGGEVAPLDPETGLVYGEEELAAELPVSPFLAADSLIEEGLTVDTVLTDNDTIGAELTRQALLATSAWSRPRPGAATARTREAQDLAAGWLSAVTVRGPSFVTMSSESGTFQVTLVNGLDQPVTVGLRASVPGGRLELDTPDPVELPAGGRTSMRIDATATGIGIHLVTLQPVSTTGTAIGTPSSLSVRTSRVGFILWVVMAVGGALLFVVVVVRIWRRVRERRRTHGPVLQRRQP